MFVNRSATAVYKARHIIRRRTRIFSYTDTQLVWNEVLLPLSVEAVVDLLVGVGEHHNQDPQQHHAHCGGQGPGIVCLIFGFYALREAYGPISDFSAWRLIPK
jgi:hypothetical protein